MSWSPPALRVGGVTWDPPFLLAPMEGVTHRVFRDLILDLDPAHAPGAAWTEFLRVSQHALRARAIARELGPPRADVPVGVQLMGIEPALVEASAAAAIEAGAPMVDLNFGCPAPRVFNKCAGSALLDFPDRIEALVRAAVAGARPAPVTAKLRLGTRDAALLPQVLAAVEAGGAAAITLHARTRADGYAHPARWEELSRARALTRLPLVGNGDVLTCADARRMLEQTGVDGVMIGRGALRDPWLFVRLSRLVRGAPAPAPGPADLLRLHRRYRDDMLAESGRELGVLGQLKQLWRRLEVVVAISDQVRTALLRAQDLAAFDALVDGLCAQPHAAPPPALPVG